MLAGHKVVVILDFADPGGLFTVTEVEEGDQLLALIITADAEYMVVVSLNGPGPGFAFEDAVLAADLDQLLQAAEDPAFSGGRIISSGNFIPAQVAAVEVAAVFALDGIIVIVIVVLLADLVTAVEYRDTALYEHEGMQHQIQADGAVQLPVVLLIFRGLDTAEGSCRAAESGIAQTGIIVVELAAAVATEIAQAAQIIVQIFLVGHLFDAELFEVLIIQAPADIIMAAQIVQEGILLGQLEYGIHLMAQKTYVLGGDSMPEAGHGRYVVEHVALRLLNSSEIRNDFLGLHNDFTQKQGAGTYDIGRHVHQPDQGVYLRQVTAVGAQFLPDIRSRVQTDNVDAVIAEVEHIRCHIVENSRIRVVQIPLIGIEGRHDDFAGLLAPGEVSGGCGGEDLGYGLLELIGDIPVIIEEVPVLIFLLAGAGAFCPLMIFTGVVHNEINADAHAQVVAFVAQGRQILHGAQLGLDLAEVGNGIAAVASVLGALQQRHQVEIVDAAFLDIVKMLPDALQVAREAVGIHEHAQHLISLIPVRHQLPGLVPVFQKGTAL